MPNPCETAATKPANRPPLSVCCSTTANDGPGDIAPSRQIETTVNQIAIDIIGKFAPLSTCMHLLSNLYA